MARLMSGDAGARAVSNGLPGATNIRPNASTLITNSVGTSQKRRLRKYICRSVVSRQQPVALDAAALSNARLAVDHGLLINDFLPYRIHGMFVHEVGVNPFNPFRVINVDARIEVDGNERD